MNRITQAFTLCLAAALATPVTAHDFWIAPSAFGCTAGARIDLHLRVGHLDQAEDVVRDPARIERFALLAPDGAMQDIVGLDGRSPAGVVRPTVPGLNIAVYDSGSVAHTMEAAKFEAYLADEGLEHVIAERTRRGESSATGVEIFSRCAKSLLCIKGDSALGEESSADRPVGMRLELIALRNPEDVKPGDAMPVRVLFDGKPVAGVKIVAANLANASADNPEGQIIERSDDEGRVTLQLPVGGMWMMHAVHMQRLPECAEADWESLWASLTFEIGDRAP